MPKSRGRKAGQQSRSRMDSEGPNQSGASHRASSELTREWRVLISTAAEIDLSDPVALPSLPALYLNAIVSDYQDILPSERCVDDCLILAHACSQFGIEAQVRTTVLTITDSTTGAQETHGSLQPLWEDGMLHGHTVVWLPVQRILIDPTAEQYDGIDAYREGPVIAQADAAPGARPAGGNDKPRVIASRGFLRLRYQLGSADDARATLNHPVVHAEDDGHQRHGVNVASEVAYLLAGGRPEPDVAEVPYPRAVALVGALRDMDRQEDAEGHVLFRPSDPGSSDGHLVRLNEVPLPAGTPPVAPVG